MLLFLHLLGAAIWVGGMIFVGMVAIVSRRALDQPQRTELFRAVGSGFLVLGAIAAILLFVSGNFLVDERLGGWDGLASAREGEIVLWKLGTFALVIVLAAVHALGLGPRVRRLRAQAAGSPEDERRLRTALRLSAATQVAMLAGSLAILALAADLSA